MHDYSASLQSEQRALAIHLKLFGEEHESTADSYRQLGVTQNKMHDYSAALHSHQRVLAIRLKLFGEEHATCCMIATGKSRSLKTPSESGETEVKRTKRKLQKCE